MFKWCVLMQADVTPRVVSTNAFCLCFRTDVQFAVARRSAESAQASEVMVLPLVVNHR